MFEPHAHDFDSMNSLVRNLPNTTPDLALESLESSTPPTQVSRRSSQHQHQHTASTSQSRSRRSLASLARERTSSALASFTSISTTSTPALRNATSSSSLSQQAGSSIPGNRPNYPRTPTSSSQLSSTSISQRRASGVPLAALDRNRQSGISQMTIQRGNTNERGHGRMHQTSSRVLRMTDHDRPFTRDFKDLFATLMTSLPLTPHRVRFTRIDETFLSEEAITNLGSLKFSQSNRIPDPESIQRWVITTTTTTFSMGRDMARSTCQRFVDARMIESAESKSQTTFVPRGIVWQLTAKGTAILARFCLRNGIVAKHVESLVRREQMQIVSLERDQETDKLNQEKPTMELIFRRFIGPDGPNLKSTTSLSDSDSVSEYSSGLVGVKMAKERRVLDKTVLNTFTGKAASGWLLDCTTTIDRRETYEMAELFVKYQLMAPVIEDRGYTRAHPMATYFQPTKYAIYTITEKGQRICGWHGRPPSISSDDSHEAEKKNRMPKDSNVARLHAIIGDAALRLLFKEFLRSALCEENLFFYLDVHDFTANYRYLEKNGKLDRPESVRETLAAAYGLYNSFLASGAPSELNIDHALRNRLDSRMIRTDTDEQSMRQSLEEVVELFEQAQNSVFKLMASDSVPKFIRQPQYVDVLRDHEFDVSANNRAFSPAPERKLTERTLSRSNTGRS